MTSPLSVLFVCLGNICRSPMAEGAMRAEAKRIGLDLEVASAGTASWHIGEAPDPRAIATARAHGVDISRKRGRQVKAADFLSFTHIVGLDRQNYAELRHLAPTDGTAKLSLLLDHVPGREGQPVVDPWYGGPEDFEVAWNDVVEGTRALAAELAAAR
jgi:protein-tyrosine phosphatase